jgi:hypothetical protein
VKRKLELKELKGVLDISAIEECGTELRARMQEIRMPGKIYGALLSETSRGFRRANNGKRKRTRNEVENAEGTESPEMPTNETRVKMATASTGKEVSVRPEKTRQNQTNTEKATKADNAAIPVFLWNEAVCRGVERFDISDPKLTNAFDVIREELLLPVWKRKVTIDLAEWLQTNKNRLSNEEFAKSAEAGKRALSYVGRASWWKWDAGSYPFFWRWPEEFQKEIRDGLAPRFRDVPPRCKERQRVNPDPDVRKKEKEKINKVIKFGYLIRTCWEGLKSWMHFFSVTKDDNHIRMVYNGTKSGLNLFRDPV